jgi:type I restriction enzyme S subunit
MIWQRKTLGEVTNLKRGFDLPAHSRAKGPFPLYSSSGLTGNNNVPAVSGPCVITGRYGTIGDVFYSDGACWPLNTTLYTTEFKGNNPKFIYYLLKTIPWSRYTTASAVPGINRNHINLCPVFVPEIRTQRAIVNILETLDEKIALNNQINGYLAA